MDSTQAPCWRLVASFNKQDNFQPRATSVRNTDFPEPQAEPRNSQSKIANDIRTHVSMVAPQPTALAAEIRPSVHREFFM